MSWTKQDHDIIIKEFENDICPVCGKPIKLHRPIELVYCLRKSQTRMISRDYPSRGKNTKRIRPPDFKFSKIELKLEVTNSKTMMIHHTQIWNLINSSNEPKDIINYSISGDIPKDFEDLNVRVKDKKGKRLKISSLITTNPLYKEFKVHLDKPIKPNGTKFLRLEWDWEEPVDLSYTILVHPARNLDSYSLDLMILIISQEFSKFILQRGKKLL